MKSASKNSDLEISGLFVNLPDQPSHKIAVLHQIASSEAYQIGLECNGSALMDSNQPGESQIRGKATWAKPINGSTDVYIYLGPTCADTAQDIISDVKFSLPWNVFASKFGI